MTGYHTRWVRPEAEGEDPERIAIRKALAFGKATESTIALLSRLAGALDADVRLTAGHDLGSLWFET